jgi:hypothetical protein
MTSDFPILSTCVFSFGLVLGCVDRGTGEGSGADSDSDSESTTSSESGDGDGDGDGDGGDGDGDGDGGDGDPGDGDPGDGDGDTGDGDGDTGDGDGDGDTGDGDTGDGDGDTGDGDGDGGEGCAALGCGDCFVCGKDDPNVCADQKSACEGDPDCVEIYDCMYWCGAPVDPEFNGVCMEACVEGMPGADLYLDLATCLSCDVCDCSDYWQC